MRAAQLTEEGAAVLELRTVPTPDVGPGECLVQVEACGICASDLHILDGTARPSRRPITLGHEAAGTVVSAGGVEALSEGDRVVIDPIIGCGACEACAVGRRNLCLSRTVIGLHRDGALADFIAVPEASAVRLPAGLSFREGAMVEPAATPYHALTTRAPVREGDAVVVIGIGALGRSAVQVARLLGAGLVIGVDIAPRARERALALAADAAVDGSRKDAAGTLRELTDGGAHVVVDCVGNGATVALGCRVLRPGGVVALLGIGHGELRLPSSLTLVWKQLDVRGVFGYGAGDIAAVVDLVGRGQLEVRGAVSEVFPLTDVVQAVRVFREGSGSIVRVVVEPSRQGATSNDRRQAVARQPASPPGEHTTEGGDSLE